MPGLKIKSETTIRRYMKELEAVVKSDDIVASRLAYFALHAIRRVVEDVKGWPSLTDDAFDTAKLIMDELEQAEASAITELRKQKIA